MNEELEQGERRWLPLALSLGLVAIVAVGWRGGYTDAARGAVIVLGGIALAIALDRSSSLTLRAARSPVVVLLALLALLGGLSALWTVASAEDALRWAAVLLAVAAIVAAAAALPGPTAHAGILLTVAATCAVVGLIGAIGHVDRIGLDICGAWRPAGTLEYSNALGLLCASALPCAVAGMARFEGAKSAGFAALGLLLAATVASSGSRLEVALAASTLIAAAALLPAERRASPAAAAGALVLGGMVFALITGGELGNDDAAIVVLAFLSVALFALAWPFAAGLVGSGARGPWVAAVCVIGVLGIVGSTAAERVGGCAYAGLAHGRTGIWTAAIRSADEKPLFGHGLESFAVASRAEQLKDRPVPVQFAHSLPLEAWVELGAPGVLLVLGLFAAVGVATLRATREAGALLGPAAIAFLVANLLDWPWHLAGCTVFWAIAVGGLIGSRLDRSTAQAD